MNLQDHLTDLAEDVRPVDLSDRVRIASRRVTTRRRAAVAAAVLVAGSGVAWTARPAPDRPVDVAATESPAAASEMPNTLVYHAADGTLTVVTGGTARAVSGPGPSSCGLTVSPDGYQLAWVTRDGGDLVVAARDGTGARTLMDEVTCGVKPPAWMPASTHLIVYRNGGAQQLEVEASTGAAQPGFDLERPGVHLARSPNGIFVAYAISGEIVVASPDGVAVHRFAHAGEAPTGISDDATRVVAGSRLIDTATGAEVPLPIAAGATLYPLRHGLLLARVGGELHLFGPGEKPLEVRPEPPGLHTATLLPSYL